MNAQDLKKANQEEIEPPQDWHYADVISELRKKGVTLSNLAAKHGLTTGGTFSKALRNSNPLAEVRIADALGLHPKVIWPTRYNEDGSRKLQGFHALQCKRIEKNVNGSKAAEINHAAA